MTLHDLSIQDAEIELVAACPASHRAVTLLTAAVWEAA